MMEVVCDGYLSLERLYMSWRSVPKGLTCLLLYMVTYAWWRSNTYLLAKESCAQPLHWSLDGLSVFYDKIESQDSMFIGDAFPKVGNPSIKRERESWK